MATHLKLWFAQGLCFLSHCHIALAYVGMLGLSFIKGSTYVKCHEATFLMWISAINEIELNWILNTAPLTL